MKMVKNKFVVELTSWDAALIFEALIHYDVGAAGIGSSFLQTEVEDVCSEWEELMSKHEVIE